MLEKMKDKNGFTLPEVLTVITIMSVIIILTTSIAVRMLDQTKKKISDMDEKSLIESARVYGEDLDKNNKSYYLIDDMSFSSGTVIHANAEINDEPRCSFFILFSNLMRFNQNKMTMW